MKHLSLAVLFLVVSVAFLTTPAYADRGHRNDVVRVAPPTGDPATDVANIEAAIAAAGPGDTVKFRRGTYQVFEDTQFLVATPGVTLKGKSKGRTTIQDELRDVSDPFFTSPFEGVFRLVGGDQAIRDLRIADSIVAVTLGGPGEVLGGYVIEDCVFDTSLSAVTFTATTDDVSIIEDNRFINVGLAAVIFGDTVHFLDNRVTAPTPETVPGFGQPVQSIQISPEFFSGATVCEDNVVEGNTIIGTAEGVIFFADPGDVCRNNVVRDNEFVDMKVFTEFNNGAMVNLVAAAGSFLEDNVIEDNELEGSEGIGIAVEGAGNNRIVGNEIEDLPGEKIPFSAAFLSALPGTGIYLDEFSFGNLVDDNELEDVRVPILELGDNIIGDNEIENDDEDDGDDIDSRVLTDDAKVKGASGAEIHAAASRSQSAVSGNGNSPRRWPQSR